ncbi:zinc finger CCCH domain-containing protein 48-like [Tripterygium wilfordii]|uniref:Zinc finger CCCH domain-containing protein 48-like n=1 Tax=Tripterygium wilfordii TaxID=458696 RepID=A0A7J7DUM6_TRIWF|nr:zinc finger CCCH domain-containing protein 48-like [Tripterygium wilfordii]KAF5749836.1 zinc finger CCCH domain-containing protein 48-like [Tripterygium wilfordii]
MAVTAAKGLTGRPEGFVLNRLGEHTNQTKNVTCSFWLAGKCTKNPCRFMHRELPLPAVQGKIAKKPHTMTEGRTWKRTNHDNPKGSSPSTAVRGSGYARTKKALEGRSTKKPQTFPGGQPTNPVSPKGSSLSISVSGSGDTKNALERFVLPSDQDRNMKKLHTLTEDQPRESLNHYRLENSSISIALSGSGDTRAENAMGRICKDWVSGNCMRGDQCNYLHSWSCGDAFSMMAKLGGHTKSVTGITLPSGSDKLFSSGKDGTARIWDCHTGQCVHSMNLGDEIGSLISEGSWVFVGLPNVVKAWNVQTSVEYNLIGPVGQVYGIAIGNDILFAGAQDGVILAWKGSSESDPPFQLAASLEGHTSAVTCLTVGAMGLYSGSMDQTIRAWDLNTLKCTHKLNGHNDVVMSLLCWDQFLLSCSLDHKINVWYLTEEGILEVAYTHNMEHGALAFCGIVDTENKPILLCSCKDNIVHLFELPSFTERGKIFSKGEVTSIENGPENLFFIGDASGDLTVWKLGGQSS